jgi:hypothetical protein
LCKTMRDYYVEGSLVVPLEVRHLFEWLVTTNPALTVTTASAEGAPAAKKARGTKEREANDLHGTGAASA